MIKVGAWGTAVSFAIFAIACFVVNFFEFEPVAIMLPLGLIGYFALYFLVIFGAILAIGLLGYFLNRLFYTRFDGEK